VEALRDEFQIPGTRVLQFAFDEHEDNPHLPQNFVSNTVVYSGTHDNPTSREWFEELAKYQQESRIFNHGDEPGPALIGTAWSSRAALAIAPLQDLLNLGREARMNIPGLAGGNWRWRCAGELLTHQRFDWLRDLTRHAKRLGDRDAENDPSVTLSACWN
jgi:4-alpha-glucanotransferase